MPSSKAQAIIQITTSNKNLSINYSRRMYAIIRRYTPDVSEGEMNECFADLTGLRTFFGMTYKQIAEKIHKDLRREIGINFSIKPAPIKMLTKNKKVNSVSTYKEMNKLFAGATFFTKKSFLNTTKTKKNFTVPFIGRVS